MLKPRTNSISKTTAPNRIQNIRLAITQQNESKTLKVTSPALKKLSPAVQKPSQQKTSLSRNKSKSNDKSLTKNVSKGKTPNRSPSVSKKSFQTGGKQFKVQTKETKGKSIREVRLMNTRTTSKGVTTSKRSLSKKENEKLKLKSEKPSKINDQSEIQNIEVSSFNENCNSSISIYSRGNNYEDSCEVESILKYIPPQPTITQPCLQHFQIITPCTQQGSYFSDYLAVHKTTGLIFTLRKISKQQVAFQQREKELVQALKIQFYLSGKDVNSINKIYAIFDDIQSIFLVLEPIHPSFTQNLWSQAQSREGLEEDKLSLCTKQLAQTIHLLHSKSIMARVLNLQGLRFHFGTLKIDQLDHTAWMGPKRRRNSFCGDIETIAPQLARGCSYDLSYDMWQVGLVIYSLSTGLKPFQGEKALESIRNLQFGIPFGISEEIGSLLDQLLSEQSQRMTIDQLLKNPFLKKSKQFINRQIWSFWDQKSTRAQY